MLQDRHPTETSSVAYQLVPSMTGTVGTSRSPHSKTGGPDWFQRNAQFSVAETDWSLTNFQGTVAVPKNFEVIVEVPSSSPIRLRVPFLYVNVSDEDGDGIFVVTDSFSTVYGQGERAILALSDYADSLAEHYIDLEENKDILGPGLQLEFAAMSRVLARA